MSDNTPDRNFAVLVALCETLGADPVQVLARANAIIAADPEQRPFNVEQMTEARDNPRMFALRSYLSRGGDQ